MTFRLIASSPPGNGGPSKGSLIDAPFDLLPLLYTLVLSVMPVSYLVTPESRLEFQWIKRLPLSYDHPPPLSLVGFRVRRTPFLGNVMDDEERTCLVRGIYLYTEIRFRCTERESQFWSGRSSTFGPFV